jgi:hypothetical protein
VSVTGNTNTATGSGDARGIFDTDANSATDTSVTGNTNSASGAGDAEGIFDTQDLTLLRVAVTGNTNHTASGDAEGVLWPENVTVTESTIASNTNSTGTGTAVGAILTNISETIAVTNSTISGNTASGTTTMGGAIFQGSFSSASASSSPGGANQEHSAGKDVSAQAPAVGSVTLVYDTIVQNAAHTGSNIDTPNVLTSFGSVVALGSGGANCVLTATTISHGWNFSNDASCGFTNTASGDKQNAGDPGLGALADNGGPGPTQLPQTGSPLIDAIPVASCQADGASGVTTDERGVTRPQMLGCDIGAVEVQPAPPPTPAAPPAVLVQPAFTG